MMSSSSSSSAIRSRLVAQLLEQLLVLGEAARDQLGRRDLAAVRSATVVTTISTPSSESRRRSRSATSWTSPTPRPSTNVTPAGIGSTMPTPSRRQLDDGAVLGDHDPRRRDARLAAEPGVRGEHPVLAVDRHQRLRAHEREHRAHLLRARVPGDVHHRDLLVQHLGAEPREPVDRVVDVQLVAGHRLAPR